MIRRLIEAWRRRRAQRAADAARGEAEARDTAGTDLGRRLLAVHLINASDATARRWL